jgi:hypothetical protein
MRLCEVEGCGKKHEAKGHCSAHYTLMRRRGRLHTIIRPAGSCNLPCEVAGCGNLQLSKGLCNAHYSLLRVRGRLHTTIRPRGTGTVDHKGYLKIKDKAGKTRFVHRVIVEQVLGHPLPEGAQIHHVDGDKLNNTHSNLVVCPDTAYHSLLHIRADALAISGHVDWRKCSRCGEYDAPAKMRLYAARGNGQHWHRKKHGNCIS